MTFSISFPSMLRRTIKQKFFEESYASLFGLEIIDVDLIKYKGQYLWLIYILVILMKFKIYLSFFFF